MRVEDRIGMDIEQAVARLKGADRGPEASLARAVEACLDDMLRYDVQRLIAYHLHRLGATDAAGNWKHPDLAVDFSDVTPQMLKDLTWRMAVYASNNHKMHQAAIAMAADAPAMAELAGLESKTAVAREAVAFAMVLDRLTRAYATDAGKIEKLLGLGYVPGGVLGDIAKEGCLAWGFKFSIVEDALEGIVAALKRGTVSPNEFRKLLQLNINVMAVVDDPDNKVAGLCLSAHAAGVGSDGVTALPVTLDRDSNLIRLSYLADPTEWVSMYNTWNAALVLHSNMAPFFLMKLLVPAVGNFYADPGAYMHNRVVALYMFMVWRRNGPDAFSTGETVDWSMPKLAHAMARQNRVNAEEGATRFGTGEQHGPLVTIINRLLGTPRPDV
jgi:hypothetical protein